MKNNVFSEKPAILGGKPFFSKPFAPYLTIGKEEREAVQKVMEGGVLSGFIGAWRSEFYGGPKVREFEEAWANHFGVKYAIAVNSATSGLYASIGTLGIEPGDEIIVTPTTMTATVTGIVLYQAIPIFADICPETFCIDPRSVEKLITSRTRAIIGVDIYGETAEWDKLRDIAKKYNLKLIEDAAQALGGKYNGKRSGTFADIGVYSLNRHKHIHCGEGGICVTNDAVLAERLQLIRNHGEAVVGEKGTENIVNMIGFNFRLNEIEAAIAIEQLKKLDHFVSQRQQISKAIIEVFSDLPGIIPPVESPIKNKMGRSQICRSEDTVVEHVYYYLCFKIDEKVLGMSRHAFVQAMLAEGIPLGEGGYFPVYLQPMYQKKIAFGSRGYPFTAAQNEHTLSYGKGLCPVAERMWFRDLFYVQVQSYVPSFEEIAKFSDAAKKVLHHRSEVEQYFQEQSQHLR